MKNLITIVLIVFLTLSSTSCASLSDTQKEKMITSIRAGVEKAWSDYESLADNSNDTDLPNDDTDLAKNSVNKAEATKPYTGSSNETGFYIGIAFPNLSFSDKFGVQPEVNFIGVKDFNQIQVPILLKYNFANKFNAYGGPNLGFLLDAPSGLNTFNFALDLGLSYDITNNILVEARYGWGLTNLLDGGDSDNYVKLNNFQVGLAYKFGFKK